ncbi:hypothetical protein GCM10027088_35950 [Nocardia goodfellowii]|uniref:ABC transporter permease n=2 Tax=Nocardia goodfellowii TaxID=882446 RepID=A0ABS4Q7E2_9NOCA|nr:DUF6069 family protein [Nocardia goodfellowii]MBP2187607.1 hypothetical protein [Nocardia goodfellowii]
MSTATAIAPTTSRIPALNRPAAILGATGAALLANLVVWLIGAAAGGTFEMTDAGQVQSVAPGGIITLTVVPLLVGLTAAALLSYKWVGVLRVAAVVGSVLAVATIGLTVGADFDTASTIALSVTHLTLVPAIVVATEGLRRKLIEA